MRYVTGRLHRGPTRTGEIGSSREPELPSATGTWGGVEANGQIGAEPVEGGRDRGKAGKMLVKFQSWGSRTVNTGTSRGGSDAGRSASVKSSTPVRVPVRTLGAVPYRRVCRVTARCRGFPPKDYRRLSRHFSDPGKWFPETTPTGSPARVERSQYLLRRYWQHIESKAK